MSLLILLRLAQVSLPPVLESWRSESPEVLHELQEIFSQNSVRHNDEQLKRILREGHDFERLARSRGSMLDAWQRFARLPRHIQAALLHWTWRRFHASLTVSELRDRSFALLNTSAAASGWSWDSHCSEVLHELHMSALALYLPPFFRLFFFGRVFLQFPTASNSIVRRASMYAADINALSVHGESAVSQAPASPQASIQKAEPDTPVASYMHILENSGPPSPLQIGRFGDSPATQRYKRWYTGVKALSHFLRQRFCMFLLMRRSWCIPLRTLLRQLLVWRDLVVLMCLNQSGPREPVLLHYLNVVRSVDEWNLRLSLGRRPAGIVVLPAGMSRMPLLLAFRPNVHSPVDPVSV